MTSAVGDGSNGGKAIDILLVEDNPSYVELTLRALEDISHGDLQVEVAGSGERALEILKANGHRGPRLIILDISLPKMSGHEVLRRIREDARAPFLPVVMLSSSKRPEDVRESYRLGANGYAQRPLNFNSYIETLSNIIAYWLVVNISAPS